MLRAIASFMNRNLNGIRRSTMTLNATRTLYVVHWLLLYLYYVASRAVIKVPMIMTQWILFHPAKKVDIAVNTIRIIHMQHIRPSLKKQ